MTRQTFIALLTATAMTASAHAANAQVQAPVAAPAQMPTDQAEARPNVLVWLLDDVGFAQFSSFGGLIETPNIDRVAAMGLQFSNYHTAPICSASRAALLTGRNPHSVEMGGHALLPFDTAGYRGRIPANAGTLAANLKAAGYATYALGKWDHLPSADVSPSGPYTLWPLGQGFDHYYGFLSADSDQFHPALVRDNTPVPMPAKPDYHLSADLADEAIGMIDDAGASSKKQPFFMYWASGIAHAPHQAPKEWIERYRGKFDMGWDKAREAILKRQIAQGLVPAGTKLAPRPDGMPAWASLTSDQKKLYARQMEVFAASLSYTDAQFGRILDKLAQSGQLENTIIVITSDNGGSAEGAENGTYNENLLFSGMHQTTEENLKYYEQWGGPQTFPHYSLGWAVAGNTPFRYYKQTAHDGGTHVPMIMSWPKGLNSTVKMRDQFVYVTDIAPTVLDLAKVPLAPVINNFPQRPLEGLSFGYAINDPKAKGQKLAQYTELFGNKGLWSDGWAIVTSHRLKTWEGSANDPIDEPWELYNLRKDPGETTELAAKMPAKVAELAALYEDQAKRYGVTSVSIATAPAFQMVRKRAEFMQRRGVWRYTGPVSYVSEDAAPPILFSPFRAKLAVELPNGTETGPLFAWGGRFGGLGLYLKDGVPKFTFRALDGVIKTVAAPTALAKGANALELIVDRPRAAPMTPQDIAITIKSNGQTLVSQKVNFAMPPSFGITATFDIGNDLGDSVSEDYRAGEPFSGTIGETTFDFTPPK